MRDRTQESRRRARAPVSSNAELVGADAERGRAVKIRIARQSELDAGFHPCRGCAVTGTKVGNPEFAEAAVILALAAAITFVAAEIRQQLAITPSFGAEPFPIVEVLVLTANEDQAVDRRRSAQHTTAGPDDRAATGALARLGDEEAGKTLIENRPVVSDRELEPKIAIGPTGLQQQHAARWIGRQPVCDHAAGRSRADDDVVITLSSHARPPAGEAKATPVLTRAQRRQASAESGFLLIRQRCPLRRHTLGTALRQCKYCKRRIRRTGSRKDAGSGDPEIRNFVALAVAIDDRIASPRPHDGAAHQMAGRDRSTPRRPGFLGSARFGNLQSLFEIGIPQRQRILTVAMDQLSKRHAELVLGACQLNAVFHFRLVFAKGLDPRQIARCALHVIGEFWPE